MTVLVLVTLLALGSLTLTAQPSAAQEQQDLPLAYPVQMARTQICEDIRGNLRDIVIPTLDIVTPCGGPGWTLAASLNISDPTQNCPGEWDERTESGRRLCFRQPSGNSSAGCASATFSTDGKEYTHVCGRAIGYQYASADAFGDRGAPGTI